VQLLRESYRLGCLLDVVIGEARPCCDLQRAADALDVRGAAVDRRGKSQVSPAFLSPVRHQLDHRELMSSR